MSPNVRPGMNLKLYPLVVRMGRTLIAGPRCLGVDGLTRAEHLSLRLVMGRWRMPKCPPKWWTLVWKQPLTPRALDVLPLVEKRKKLADPMACIRHNKRMPRILQPSRRQKLTHGHGHGVPSGVVAVSASVTTPAATVSVGGTASHPMAPSKKNDGKHIGPTKRSHDPAYPCTSMTEVATKTIHSPVVTVAMSILPSYP